MRLKFLDDPGQRYMGEYVPLYSDDDRLVVRVTGRDHDESMKIAKTIVKAMGPSSRRTPTKRSPR